MRCPMILKVTEDHKMLRPSNLSENNWSIIYRPLQRRVISNDYYDMSSKIKGNGIFFVRNCLA